jgi:hypothetical protein
VTAPVWKNLGKGTGTLRSCGLRRPSLVVSEPAVGQQGKEETRETKLARLNISAVSLTPPAALSSPQYFVSAHGRPRFYLNSLVWSINGELYRIWKEALVS